MGVLDELQRPLYLGLDVGLDSSAATEEHEELLEAIKAKDPERAREIHRRQLALAGERMVEAMQSLGAASPVVAAGH